MIIYMPQKTKKVTVVDINDILNTAKKEKKSSSKVPIVKVNPNLLAIARRVRELREEMDSAKSMFDLASEDLISSVSSQRSELLKGGYSSALRIPLDDGEVNVVWTDKYSKIPESQGGLIGQVVGSKYDNYFETKIEIKVKDVSTESLTELIEAVGADRFASFFEVEKYVKPTTKFTQESCFLPKKQQEKLAELGVKQYKPSVKVK